ncbi:hypothetical protein F4804DRAFT_161755 [Jackrogersella minutella]|nr:hypothetical protein F4804DRAFT_161755 [Jackrogersella minutella]
MDIKDISSDQQSVSWWKQIEENAKRASRRKGEKPQDHPPPQLLVALFMQDLAIAANKRLSDDRSMTIQTSQVPPAYLPCVRPVQELKPLLISRMTLEHHHRGNQVKVHVMTPPNRMTAVMAIVEDEQGTAVLLQLYNQPEESKVSNEHILQPGDVCIVKEPYFKDTTNGGYSLRVDHVSDIIWLQESDPRIPLKWRKRVLSLDESSYDIRMRGNMAVKEQDWAGAERLYTNAIHTAKTPEEEQLAHLNRSLSNLRLGRPEKALDDARKGPPNEKALFREAKALYSLGKFRPCLEKLTTVVRSQPNNSDAWTEIRCVKQRLQEEETGSYQFSSMYKQAKATPPLIDCATYIGSVAVRDSPLKGKGLFTTKRVKAGELLLCEKAFTYSYADADAPIGCSNTTVLMNLSSKKIILGGVVNLIVQTVQKLYHNHTGAEIFTDLHHGDYAPVNRSEVDGTPIIDTFLVMEIIRVNSFGAGRTSHKQFMDTLNGLGEVEPDHTTCGVWPIASRINHSCITNCRRSFIGDMQIVRACKDLEPNTEVYFGYHHSSVSETFETAQEKLKNWGFVCNCLLCLDKKSTPLRTIRLRESLNRSLLSALKLSIWMAHQAQVKKMLEDLEKTYASRPDACLVPRLELSEPYIMLGTRLIAENMFADGLEMTLKGLEAIGYVIVACPPRNAAGENNKKNIALEIKRWGIVDVRTAIAFFNMMQAYETLAPELCKITKEYVGIAYSICCGEKETINAGLQEFSRR